MNTYNNTQAEIKYFIYCRKSSEDEGKQILSLPAQKKELQDYAKKFHLKIVDVLAESKSAFKPGRDGFNEMLDRIGKGEANGILTWQANRIARNSKDGGNFIYLMDEGKVKELKTPYKTFTNSSDDKFILNIEFGMAKKDSDDKSDNVKRGNYYKFHTRKVWVGPAKLGYVNFQDEVTKEKKIKVDKDRFTLIQKAIYLILDGTHTPMEALHILNNDYGFRTRKTKKQGGRPIAKSGWYKLLSDSFYYGLMVRSEGEVMGTHKPMLTQDEFDKLQIVLGRKGKPRISRHKFAYKEVLKCGECRGSVTCEEKWQIICSKCKTKFHKGKLTDECSNCHTLLEEMKNPKILHYVYYHCTKRVNTKCTQGHITLKNLEKKIVDELVKFEITEEFRDWAIEHLNELNDHEEVDQTSIKDNLILQLNNNDKAIRNLLREKISPENAEYSSEMQEYYESEKKRLFKEKTDIKKALQKFDEREEQWFEQTKEAFDFACTAKYNFEHGNLKAKTYVLSRLGSNLTIKDKTLHISGDTPYFLIEKGKKEIEGIINALEPAKKAEISSNLLSFEPVSSALLRG